MTTSAHHIRRLEAADQPAFRAVRLDMLRLHPEAFGSSFEEESQLSPEDMVKRLLSPPATMFGGFANDALVGVTGLRVETRSKARHKGHVFCVYVAATDRRTGLARALVQTAINQAIAQQVRVLQLTVTVGNDAARAVYTALGFRSFGIEHRALWVDGKFFHTEHMVLDLD